MSSQPTNTNPMSQPGGHNSTEGVFSAYARSLGLFTPRHFSQHIRPDYRQIPPPPQFPPGRAFASTHAVKPATAPKKQALKELLCEVRKKGRKMEPVLTNRIKKCCDNKKYGCKRYWDHKTEECEMSAAERKQKNAQRKAEREMGRMKKQGKGQLELEKGKGNKEGSAKDEVE